MDRVLSGRFLIVDDEEVWRRHGASALGPFGQVTTATSVAQALELLDADSRFIGYLLDIELGDGTGFEVLEVLRGRNLQAPALMLTSHHEREQINRAHALGAEFLCKPPEFESLAAFARRAVALHWTSSRRVASLVDSFATERRLTPREVEILSGAVAGMPRRLVASQLGVSENTLKVQIRHLLLKCNATSLDELSDAVLRRAIGSSGLRQAVGNEVETPPSRWGVR